MTREQLLAALDTLERSAPRFTIRMEAPHFVAAVDVERGVVVHAAPIVAYMRGWHFARVMDYAQRKGWRPMVL